MTTWPKDATVALPLLHGARLAQALRQHNRSAARQARQDIVLAVWMQLRHNRADHCPDCQLPRRISCTCMSAAEKPARSAGNASCGLQAPHIKTSTAA